MVENNSIWKCPLYGGLLHVLYLGGSKVHHHPTPPPWKIIVAVLFLSGSNLETLGKYWRVLDETMQVGMQCVRSWHCKPVCQECEWDRSGVSLVNSRVIGKTVLVLLYLHVVGRKRNEVYCVCIMYHCQVYWVFYRLFATDKSFVKRTGVQ